MIRLILLAILFYHFYLFGNNPDAYFSYGDIELDSWDIASNKNIHSGVNLCCIWIESAYAFSLYRDLGLNDLLFTLNYYRAVYRSNNSIEINGQRSKENNNSLVKDLNNQQIVISKIVKSFDKSSLFNFNSFTLVCVDFNISWLENTSSINSIESLPEKLFW